MNFLVKRLLNSNFSFRFNTSDLRNKPKTKVFGVPFGIGLASELVDNNICDLVSKNQPDTIKIDRVMIFARLRIRRNTSQKFFGISHFRRPSDQNWLSGNKDGMKMASRRNFGHWNGAKITFQSRVMNFLVSKKTTNNTLIPLYFHCATFDNLRIR